MEIFLAQEGPFPPEESGQGDGGFEQAAGILCRIKGAPLLDRVDRGRARVATIDRFRPTGARIARDPASGSWLVAAGTWFHPAARAGGDRALQLLRSYLDGGERFWDAIDGYFGLALFDGRAGELVVGSDIVGCFHVYYRLLDGYAFVSTSSLALAALGDREPDPVSQFEFLAKGTVFEDRTLYRAVRKCRPGTVHRFRDGREAGTRRYWRVADLPIGSLAGERAVDALERTLVAAAAAIPEVARRPLTDLTGGYDSRAVVAALLAAGVPVATTVGGDARDPDVRASARIASAMGFPHRHSVRPPDWPARITAWAGRALSLTEGEYDVLEYAGILHTHCSAIEAFDMTLNGSAGGMARGTWWEVEFPRAGARRPLDVERLARERFAIADYDGTIFGEGFAFDLTEHFGRIIAEANRGLEHGLNTAQIDNAYLMLRLQRWQGRVSSATTQLWPCLSLFACRGPLEAALCASPADRKGSLLIRRLLHRMNPRLAAFPLAAGYPASPPSILSLRTHVAAARDLGRRGVGKLLGVSGIARRAPAGASLLEKCIQAMWKDEAVRSLLDPRAMASRDLFRPEPLRTFFEASRREGFSHVRQLGRIYTLERTAALLRELPPLPRPVASSAR